jgi:serine/threonine protein kinase
VPGTEGSVTMDRYTQLKTIGKGSFGTVTLVRRNADSKVLVWKELDYGRMTEREKKHVVTEVNLLRELRHPYIVKYCDRIIDKQTTKLYIVMEYCPGGDLGKLIKKHRTENSYMKEKYIWKFVSQLVLALEECHMHKDSTGNTKPILHRDIKPANIFIDTSGDVKLGDFGLARELSSESKFAETYVGTPYYMSPELISQLKYNKTCDIWAVGCLAYELAALRPPFEASNHLSLALKISEGQFPRIPSRYSDALQQFIQSALQVNVSKIGGSGARVQGFIFQ